MENYHLFITDEQSLKFHIEYGFVGTGQVGAGFNIGLWKDIQRLKIRDKVIFYVQGLKQFFGIFEVSSAPFFDTSNPLYLSAANPVTTNGSPVELRYRSLISPHTVFEKGISEFELVDILPSQTRDVLWSVLYRKLKGKRGNSPLFPSEFETIQRRLTETNNNRALNHTSYSFNAGYIVQGNPVSYRGSTASNVNLKASIIQGNYSEHHIHALLLSCIPSTIFGVNCVWVGNEVYSGAGMQAIDLMSIVDYEQFEQFWPIEVKKGVVSHSIFDQIEKYCRWIAGRFDLGTQSNAVQPVLVGLEGSINQKKRRAPSILTFNQKAVSLPLKYFEYSINALNNQIIFNEVDMNSPNFNSLSRFVV